MHETTTLLFDEPGPQNTEATLAIALRRAQELSLSTVVVASDNGKTARAALDLFKSPIKVVVVSNPPGMALPIAKLHSYLPRFQEWRASLEAQGKTTVSASLSEPTAAELTTAGAAVLRVDWRKLGAYTRNDLRALECIGVGVRVGVTVSIAAVLAGTVPESADVIALSGTGFGGGGADTALVVRTASRWRDWRVLEILARPRIGPPGE
ncbi:MAG: hypothetical protein HY898_28740 [Deltaproteobacteria bacterium]|nr:hypothetical protein [Deltaproteobacteria bacterium]